MSRSWTLDAKVNSRAHVSRTRGKADCKSCTIRVFLVVGDLIEAKKPKTGVPHLLKDNLRNGDKVEFISINNFMALLMYC